MNTFNLTTTQISPNKNNMRPYSGWQFEYLTYSDINLEPPGPLNYSVSEFYKQLPTQEQVVLDMYYYKKLPQTIIAKKLNLGQATISFRLRRARRRLKYMVMYREVSKKIYGVDLSNYFDKINLNIIRLMLKYACITRCQTEMERLFPKRDFSFTKIRHAWQKILHEMDQNDDLIEYRECVDFVQKNYNILNNYYDTVGVHAKRRWCQRNAVLNA